MNRRTAVNLGNLILSFSDAMDLASPDLTQHQQRTAYISWRIGKKAQLGLERIEAIFVAALLHDIGAFSIEEKEAAKYDEMDNIEEHCLRGHKLLHSITWLQKPAEIVRYHHTPFRELTAMDIATQIDVQILYLADYIERQIDREKCILQQQEKIIRKVTGLTGSHFHPQIVEYFLEISYREEFWLDLVSPRLYDILKEGPFNYTQIEFDDILIISELFRNIIDLRSRFTSTHSSGVSIAAALLAQKFGFTETEVKMMKVAGNLHDIGKLAIPNNILNKDSGLSKEETAVMRSHTYHTYAIISKIEGMEEIARWAGYHHEKLDGSGYPFHCEGNELSSAARIMAVADIFTALVENRPYRAGLQKPEITKIFQHFISRNLIDAKIVELLYADFDEIYDAVKSQQAQTRSFYEKQFEFKKPVEKAE